MSTEARQALENLIARTVCAAWEAHDPDIESTDGESSILTDALTDPSNRDVVLAAMGAERKGKWCNSLGGPQPNDRFECGHDLWLYAFPRETP
jgi:hypothetical protein